MAKGRKATPIDFPIIDIRKGVPADAEACQKMLRQHPKSFGFVMLPALRKCAERGGLHIAHVDGDMVGFVSYNTLRTGQHKGWQAIHELCVDESWHGKGVGRALLYSVPTPIRLKCPVDLDASNKFYAGAGMGLEGVQTEFRGEALKRPLNIWTMRVLAIHCQGGNKNVPVWARNAGMAYGTRSTERPHEWPFMLDVHWKKVNTTDKWMTAYLPKVYALRPVMAIVRDYESPTQREDMLREVQALRDAGVLRICVIPKFIGAVADIPADCWVAISVYSRHAGFMPDKAELVGRKNVHLLGGSPSKQADAVTKYEGMVRSSDYNCHETAAKKGRLWDGVWIDASPLARRNIGLGALAQASGKNIREHLNRAARFKQLTLL